MARKLSKIAKELNISIGSIVNFLTANDYQCEENPNKKIEEDIFDFIKDNIFAYLAEQEQPTIDNTEIVSTEKEENKEKNSSLDLQIIETATREKKLIERIIGFTDFNWQYTIAKYKGICSQPVKFTLFDEVLSELLLIKEMGAPEIGVILGLDVEKDPAEAKILFSAINELKKDGMIDGDGSIYWLTDIGKKYAQKGEKFSTFQKDFELYIDNIGNIREKAKEIFSNLRSEKTTAINNNSIPSNIEEVKSLAELQAPEVHFPTNGFLLQSYNNLAVEQYKAKVWVILLENFKDNSIRALIYDEKKNQIIETLSEAFDKLEDKKQKVLQKLIDIGEQEDFSITYTDEKKNETQIALEKELIEKQSEIDKAIEEKNIEKVSEIQKQIIIGKRLFNSLEFEIELKRLFDETTSDMWIISPWIKKNAINRRLPFFEKYLQKGGRIFVAYSLPENNTEMADEEALTKLLELERKYQNFYIHQLPPFHYKRVWIRDNKKQEHLYYTGSYNILSFFVKQGYQNVRQEEMTKLLWEEENENEYKEVFRQFAEKYLQVITHNFNEIITNIPQKINKEFLQQVKNISYNKLSIFTNKGFKDFDEQYQILLDSKNTKLKQYRELYFYNEIDTYQREAQNLIQQKTAPYDKKKNLQTKLNSLLNEFAEYRELEQVSQLTKTIQNIKTLGDNKSKLNNNFKNKRRK